MKASNIINKAWDFAKNGDDRRQLIVVYLFTLVATMLMFACLAGFSCYPDTETYFRAGDLLASGNIDHMRTPVYPLVCHFAQVLWAQHPFRVIAAIQLAGFYASVFFMFRLCGLMVSSRAIRFLVTIYYACAPNFLWLTFAMLTESLSVSSLIIFCYTVIQSHRTGAMRYAACSFLLLVMLVFLRPIFIFLLPITSLLWIVSLFTKARRAAAANLVFLSVFCGVFLSYCKAFENKYGIFSTTIISNVNQFDILRNNGLYDPDVIKDEQMRKDVKAWMVEYEDSGRTWHGSEQSAIIHKYGHAAFQQFIHDNIKAHLREYITNRGMLLVKLQLTPALYYQNAHLRGNVVVNKCFTAYVLILVNSLSFNVFYLVVMFSGIAFVALGIRRKRLPASSLFLWLIVVANLLTCVIGAQGEYARLLTPCMPMFYVLVAMLADMPCVSLNKNLRVR